MVHHPTGRLHTTVAHVIWTAAGVNDVAIPSHTAGPSSVTSKNFARHNADAHKNGQNETSLLPSARQQEGKNIVGLTGRCPTT